MLAARNEEEAYNFLGSLKSLRRLSICDVVLVAADKEPKAESQQTSDCSSGLTTTTNVSITPSSMDKHHDDNQLELLILHDCRGLLSSDKSSSSSSSLVWREWQGLPVSWPLLLAAFPTIRQLHVDLSPLQRWHNGNSSSGSPSDSSDFFFFLRPTFGGIAKSINVDAFQVEAVRFHYHADNMVVTGTGEVQTLAFLLRRNRTQGSIPRALESLWTACPRLLFMQLVGDASVQRWRRDRTTKFVSSASAFPDLQPFFLLEE